MLAAKATAFIEEESGEEDEGGEWWWWEWEWLVFGSKFSEIPNLWLLEWGILPCFLVPPFKWGLGAGTEEGGSAAWSIFYESNKTKSEKLQKWQKLLKFLKKKS